jgi:hypothetical protein
MAKLNAADARYISESANPTSVRTSLLLGGKNQWAVELTLQTTLPHDSTASSWRGARSSDRAPVPDRATELFRALDADSDGVVTKDEFLRGLSGSGPARSPLVDAEPVVPPRLHSNDPAASPGDATTRIRVESRMPPRERVATRRAAEAETRVEPRMPPRERVATQAIEAEAPAAQPPVPRQSGQSVTDAAPPRRAIPQRTVPGASRLEQQSRLEQSPSAPSRAWTPSEVDTSRSSTPGAGHVAFFVAYKFTQRKQQSAKPTACSG